MTKRDLVVQISNDTGMIQQDVQVVVQRALDLLSEALARGQTVELRNFGVFEIKLRRARVGRNPNAPAHDVRIPPRAVVKFKAGKKLRATVIKLSSVMLSHAEKTESGQAQQPSKQQTTTAS